ncbi:unnamed protein product, partial [Symbiodinium necroappetens]
GRGRGAKAEEEGTVQQTPQKQKRKQEDASALPAKKAKIPDQSKDSPLAAPKAKGKAKPGPKDSRPAAPKAKGKAKPGPTDSPPAAPKAKGKAKPGPKNKAEPKTNRSKPEKAEAKDKPKDRHSPAKVLAVGCSFIRSLAVSPEEKAELQPTIRKFPHYKVVPYWTRTTAALETFPTPEEKKKSFFMIGPVLGKMRQILNLVMDAVGSSGTTYSAKADKLEQGESMDAVSSFVDEHKRDLKRASGIGYTLSLQIWTDYFNLARRLPRGSRDQWDSSGVVRRVKKDGKVKVFLGLEALFFEGRSRGLGTVTGGLGTVTEGLEPTPIRSPPQKRQDKKVTPKKITFVGEGPDLEYVDSQPEPAWWEASDWTWWGSGWDWADWRNDCQATHRPTRQYSWREYDVPVGDQLLNRQPTAAIAQHVIDKANAQVQESVEETTLEKAGTEEPTPEKAGTGKPTPSPAKGQMVSPVQAVPQVTTSPPKETKVPVKAQQEDEDNRWRCDKFGAPLNAKALYQRFYRGVRSHLVYQIQL